MSKWLVTKCPLSLWWDFSQVVKEVYCTYYSWLEKCLTYLYILHSFFLIIVRLGQTHHRKLSLQPMVQRCYIRLLTLKICMNHINQSNFIRAKFTRRNRNWRATRIHYTQFHWVGRSHRGHAYLIENKRTSQGGPTGDERENRWESLVGYRRWGKQSSIVIDKRPLGSVLHITVVCLLLKVHL